MGEEIGGVGGATRPPPQPQAPAPDCVSSPLVSLLCPLRLWVLGPRAPSGPPHPSSAHRAHLLPRPASEAPPSGFGSTYGTGQGVGGQGGSRTSIGGLRVEVPDEPGENAELPHIAAFQGDLPCPAPRDTTTYLPALTRWSVPASRPHSQKPGCPHRKPPIA